ncbi:RNA polymerase sigma factor [Sphingobacterium paludis]|uniref:RNA polymerase sigma-70 factor (ECF subfamily) n=1 Tax=Sphingobacterium paludis TaxID=1476465 RepID=A0A4R7CV44_9SPHI|nr:sigma-70 family RNA polymerase sigma factor [Sphingobacterium paludis]TDS08909.1 RNA polymerase sigma-70 factor (ECF subfamily) [Sphingobacterium paludis]
MSNFYKTKSDEELYELVKDDDRDAYTELYDRFKKPLLVFAYKKVGMDEAEDLVHDLWIKLWHNRSSIKLERSFVSYIFGGLKNRILDHMSKVDHADKYVDHLKSYSSIYQHSDGADHQIREQLFWLQIEALLDHYGPKANSIIRLRMQGFNNHEIAEKLNLSEKTIRNQQSAIIKYLRSKLSILRIFLFWLPLFCALAFYPLIITSC